MTVTLKHEQSNHSNENKNNSNKLKAVMSTITIAKTTNNAAHTVHTSPLASLAVHAVGGKLYRVTLGKSVPASPSSGFWSVEVLSLKVTKRSLQK